MIQWNWGLRPLKSDSDILMFVIIKQKKIRLCYLNAVVVEDWAELAFKGINEKPALHMSKTSGIWLELSNTPNSTFELGFPDSPPWRSSIVVTGQLHL